MGLSEFIVRRLPLRLCTYYILVVLIYHQGSSSHP
jgi:hypothetical protein